MGNQYSGVPRSARRCGRAGSRQPVIVIADTSGSIAAADQNAPESAACLHVLAEAGRVIISPLVLTVWGSITRSGTAWAVLGVGIMDE